MEIITVLGARPQFVKSWPVSRAIREAGLTEFVIHTGQHYDYRMSELFFQELELRKPEVNLGVGSGGHGHQTGSMMQLLEPIIESRRPAAVLVYGDTNSTLAGALTAVKLHVPVVHIEAGLRSFNRKMPEEHNRILTDHCSSLLFCPTASAQNNLAREGLGDRAFLTGDVMADALSAAYQLALNNASRATERPEKENYYVGTLHRAEATDDLRNLRAVIKAFTSLTLPVILPAHPRLRQKLDACSDLLGNLNISIIEPLGYIDMVDLVANARAVFTDSGGLQKEAVWLGIPCVTLRNETEWVETLQDGYNQLAGLGYDQIREAEQQLPVVRIPKLPNEGSASQSCVNMMLKNLTK
jgi:UDP-N-acetylglucosamine 2-epimerase